MKRVPIIRDIIKYGSGDTLLQAYIKPLQVSKLPQGLGQDMSTLKHTAANNKLVSLSANQIGLQHRMFTVLKARHIQPGKWVLDDPKQPEDYDIVINPQLTGDSHIKYKDYEECPSLPALRFHIWNPIYQQYRFMYPCGNDQQFTLKRGECELKGFMARLWDHQTRHLCGILPIYQEISHSQIYVSPQYKGNPALQDYVKLLKTEIEFFQFSNLKRLMPKKNTGQKEQYIKMEDIPDQLSPAMRNRLGRNMQRIKKQIEKKSKVN